MSATESDSKGVHGILEQDHPYIFIDACMQLWPDADLSVAHRHGVTAYAPTTWLPRATVDQALEGIMYLHLIARKNPNLLVASSAEDIRRAKHEGKAAIIPVSQDGDFIGMKLHRVEAFARLGLRMLIPAYNAGNAICDGCLERTDAGLTRFGQLVVDECNRVGILLDCSHLGRRSSLDIIERSRQPVVFSHSNPKGIRDSQRNIDDEQIKAAVASGGLIGLAPYGPMVMRWGQNEQPDLDDFIDHIDYVVQLTGSTDHVAIGTDKSIGTYGYDGSDPWGNPGYPAHAPDYAQHVTGDARSPKRSVKGFEKYHEVVNFIDRLQARNYSEADIAKILGENWLRVFEQVWKPELGEG